MNKVPKRKLNDLNDQKLSHADQVVRDESGGPIREPGHYVAGADGTQDVDDDAAAVPADKKSD